MGKTDKEKIEAYKSSRRSGLTPGLTAKQYQTLVNSERDRHNQTVRERNALVVAPSSPPLTLLQEFEMRYPHLTGNAKTIAFEEYEIKRRNEEDDITNRGPPYRARSRSRSRTRTRSRAHSRTRSRAHKRTRTRAHRLR